MRHVTTDGPGSIREFRDLLEYLRDREAGATVLSSNRFCELLGIDPEMLVELARSFEAHGRTSGSASEQCFIRAALRVLSAASNVGGNLERAICWFHNESLAPFGHKTAERLIADGRVEDVIGYVMSLDAGVAG